MEAREKIAKRIAKELRDGDVVNLGIGMPTLVADYIPADIKIILQSENGLLGMGSSVSEDGDMNIVNAGGRPVAVNTGACFFDSATSFAIIRGGHVDLTVLGALQVDESGSIANHIIPGKMVPGMGGAMDLLTGSKKVIAAMTHTAKGDTAKIMQKLTLPITAVSKVNMIITELAVIEVLLNKLILREVAEESSVEEVRQLTEAPLTICDSVRTF